MTQEEKSLLLKDLCARLPYGVKCYIEFDDGKVFNERTLTPVMIQDLKSHSFLSFKPYLQSMSSMSEEEQVELGKLIGTASYNMLKGDMSHLDALLVHIYKNHIDAFGLIPQGLALEAPKEMYKTE